MEENAYFSKEIMSEIYHQKLAGMLRIDPRLVEDVEKRLSDVTGRVGVVKRIIEENDDLLKEKLGTLGLGYDSKAEEVYDALISKIEADDLSLLKYFEVTEGDNKLPAQKAVDLANKIYSHRTGFFLKKEKARELLIAEPPKNILKALGYGNVDTMLQKEDLYEVYSALRFLEDDEWQNEIFFKQYEKLTPDDFEERELELRVLHHKWAKAAKKFVAKKYHNVSHLKELGIVFVIPIFLGISGETLRLLSLLCHYCYEIRYYSELFKQLSSEPKSFAKNIISLLRADVFRDKFDSHLDGDRLRFLVIQRYLAKDDENDWRLLFPHINPEALHWQRAEIELTNLGKKLPNFSNHLDFWKDLGPVGDFFKTKTGEILISFDLVDAVMGLVKRKEFIKYLYHQQEAIWNKIFIEYFSLDELDKLSKKFILKGWFEI